MEEQREHAGGWVHNLERVFPNMPSRRTPDGDDKPPPWNLV